MLPSSVLDKWVPAVPTLVEDGGTDVSEGGEGEGVTRNVGLKEKGVSIACHRRCRRRNGHTAAADALVRMSPPR